MEKLLSRGYATLHHLSELYQAILSDTNEAVANFVKENIALEKKDNVLYFPSIGQFSQEYQLNLVSSIVDFKNINLVKDLNRHFLSMNKLLPDAGIYIGCVETYKNHESNIHLKYGKILSRFVLIIDFIINRVIPKLELTSKLYNTFFSARYKELSLSETLGRLVYVGFEIIGFIENENKTYFAVIKTKETEHTSHPSYGAIFRMRRVGKQGKMIGVYKIRTMHPYSEYLQNYVIHLNGYNEFGKVKNDFRTAEWSGILRKLFIDELPQLINVIKGEMNLVGVRPLSKVSFDMMPEDLKKDRILFKPGCIPPCIALRAKGLENVLNAERIFLREMKIAPVKTSLKFFFKSIFNIVTLRVSSN